MERTLSESINLHKRCPRMVLGEIYLIPTKEYDNKLAQKNKVGFLDKKVDIESYISFLMKLIKELMKMMRIINMKMMRIINMKMLRY